MMLSYVGALIFYYFMHTLEKDKKKQLLNKITSYVVNFIIYIWLGKVIVNLNVMVKDPFAVLAYPSDSKAFYVAVIFITINILYKERDTMERMLLTTSFLPIFLMALFIFEFIYVIIFNKQSHFIYLLLVTSLLLLYLYVNEKLSAQIHYLVFAAWSIGQMILAIVQPFTTVFNYMLSASFFMIFAITCVSLFIYHKDRCSYVHD